MIKKFAFALFLSVALFLFYKIDVFIQSSVLSFTNGIKRLFVERLDTIEKRVRSFFDQSEKILLLQKRLQESQKYKLLYHDLRFQLHQIQERCKITFEPREFSFQPVRMIAYERLGDFTSAWLDAQLQPKRFYGLVTQKGVAGIVYEDGGAKALFNGNKKCSYTVSIADGIKGIATGSGDNRYIVVKYIQSYERVEPGQRVYTNGFDDIFPYGIDVGVVQEVWLEGSYKVARVKAAEDLHEPLYFWLVQPLSNEVIK